MTENDKNKEPRVHNTPEANIDKLRKIHNKKAKSPSVSYMMMAGAAVAVVAVIAVGGKMLKDRRDSNPASVKVEVAEASLEPTMPAEEDGEPLSIVLETTRSEEEIRESERAEAADAVVDSYANLGIAEVSGYLNIRKIPESFGEVIGKLPGGAACEILDTETEGWYKISSGGVTGYASSSYIHTGDTAREMAKENVKERAIVTTPKLNVRTEPSTESDIKGQIYQGERYEVLGAKDGWVEIDQGYISSDYVEIRDSLNEARKLDMRTTVFSLYDNLGLSNVANYVNIRNKPSEKDGQIIGKFPGNAGCDILSEEENGWYKIRSGKVTGYVKGEYILTGQAAKDKALEVSELMAIANTDGVNVREKPNTDSRIWTQISNSERFFVVGQQDGWVEIELDDTNGFISTDYVDVKYGLNEAIKYTPVVEKPASKPSSKPGSKPSSKPGSKPSSGGSAVNGPAGSNAGNVSSKRAQIANYAVQFVGNPYVWGGTSLTNGADCSGFTMSIMSHFGVSLPHNAAAQSNCGKAVSSSEMRPGDLVFYRGSSGNINHVALYIGNGQVCHASSRKTGIKISSWNYRSPAKIRNVLGD